MNAGVVEVEGWHFGVKNCRKKEGSQESGHKDLVIWLLTILCIHHRLQKYKGEIMFVLMASEIWHTLIYLGARWGGILRKVIPWHYQPTNPQTPSELLRIKNTSGAFTEVHRWCYFRHCACAPCDSGQCWWHFGGIHVRCIHLQGKSTMTEDGGSMYLRNVHNTTDIHSSKI